jgi:hypothetical protein
MLMVFLVAVAIPLVNYAVVQVGFIGILFHLWPALIWGKALVPLLQICQGYLSYFFFKSTV